MAESLAPATHSHQNNKETRLVDEEPSNEKDMRDGSHLKEDNRTFDRGKNDNESVIENVSDQVAVDAPKKKRSRKKRNHSEIKNTTRNPYGPAGVESLGLYNNQHRYMGIPYNLPPAFSAYAGFSPYLLSAPTGIIPEKTSVSAENVKNMPRKNCPTKSGAKSELTKLSQIFQLCYGHLRPNGTPAKIRLNDVVEALGVTRRRMYDVINVFESLEIVRRVGKLEYEFRGYDNLPEFLCNLVEEGEIDEHVELPGLSNSTFECIDNKNVNLSDINCFQEKGMGSTSLWKLTRRLLQVMLKKFEPVSLATAASEFVRKATLEQPSHGRPQIQVTIERRLYDIGSILCSIGLVERVYVHKRQPSFEWIYGWRPGDSHPPPQLPAAVLSRQPSPPPHYITLCREEINRNKRRKSSGKEKIAAGESDLKRLNAGSIAQEKYFQTYNNVSLQMASMVPLAGALGHNGFFSSIDTRSIPGTLPGFAFSNIKSQNNLASGAELGYGKREINLEAAGETVGGEGASPVPVMPQFNVGCSSSTGNGPYILVDPKSQNAQAHYPNKATKLNKNDNAIYHENMASTHVVAKGMCFNPSIQPPPGDDNFGRQVPSPENEVALDGALAPSLSRPVGYMSWRPSNEFLNFYSQPYGVMYPAFMPSVMGTGFQAQYQPSGSKPGGDEDIQN